jgi:hypothetical protein
MKAFDVPTPEELIQSNREGDQEPV